MADKFKVGDLVWARMKGFPAWPSKVVNHPFGHTKARHHYVFFFGSYQFAWIADSSIFPYLENITNLTKKSRQRGYQEAIIGIANAYKEYVSQNEQAGTSGTNDQNDEPESIQNEQAGTSGTNDQNVEPESIQGNDEYVIKKNRIRTPEEMEERQRLINKRLRVRLLPPKNKTKKVVKKKQSSNKDSVITVKLPPKNKETKKVVKKKQSSNKDSVITVKVEDYKKIITKEVVILLERCDK